jgi:hypothetical protein
VKRKKREVRTHPHRPAGGPIADRADPKCEVASAQIGTRNPGYIKRTDKKMAVSNFRTTTFEFSPKSQLDGSK